MSDFLIRLYGIIVLRVMYYIVTGSLYNVHVVE